MCVLFLGNRFGAHSTSIRVLEIAYLSQWADIPRALWNILRKENAKKWDKINESEGYYFPPTTKGSVWFRGWQAVHTGQILPATYFVNQVLLGHSHTQLLPMVYGCFYNTMAGRWCDPLGQKYLLALYKGYQLLTSPLVQGSHWPKRWGSGLFLSLAITLFCPTICLPDMYGCASLPKDLATKLEGTTHWDLKRLICTPLPLTHKCVSQANHLISLILGVLICALDLSPSPHENTHSVWKHINLDDRI